MQFIQSLNKPGINLHCLIHLISLELNFLVDRFTLYFLFLDFVLIVTDLVPFLPLIDTLVVLRLPLPLEKSECF